jgi:hypothetical protein
MGHHYHHHPPTVLVHRGRYEQDPRGPKIGVSIHKCIYISDTSKIKIRLTGTNNRGPFGAFDGGPDGPVRGRDAFGPSPDCSFRFRLMPAFSLGPEDELVVTAMVGILGS